MKIFRKLTRRKHEVKKITDPNPAVILEKSFVTAGVDWDEKKRTDAIEKINKLLKYMWAIYKKLNRELEKTKKDIKRFTMKI